MKNEEVNENKSKKYSIDSWIGLAVGIGIGVAMDNYILGSSLGVVFMLLINSRKPKKDN